jgi:hypothetical protein
MKASRKGSTLVELALVSTLFLVLLSAILDFGQVLFFHHFLDDRVRAGARYAVVHAYDTTAIQNFVAYNNPAGPPPGGGGLFGLTPSMVQVTHYDAGTPNDRIEVKVSTFVMHFHCPWLIRDFTPAPFRSVMPIESAGNAL